MECRRRKSNARNYSSHFRKTVETAAYLNPEVSYGSAERFQLFWGVSEAMGQAKLAGIAATKNSLPVLIESVCATQSRKSWNGFFSEMKTTARAFYGRLGTAVCLSDVHCMPLYLQNKLTEFMDMRQFQGALCAKVRIYATTTIDLEQFTASGRFSADLWNLVSQNKIVIPDIWDDSRDAKYYFRRFLKEFSEKYHKEAGEFPSEFWERILKSERKPDYLELRGMAERLVAGYQDGIGYEALSADGHSISKGRQIQSQPRDMEEYLRHLLATEPKKSKIAKTLGISRATLYRWIEKYAIDRGEE